ncbi:MAG: YihY/virulence factor BrkB family protein [Gemmatimonadetes bacterium]|nr:YihY/virulence factor BrkB family protein [Gemmatimonadota bacterium]
MKQPHIPKPFRRKIRVRRFLSTIYSDNVLFLASALSFDALLAAVPLALLFLALLGADELRVALDVIMPSPVGGGEEPLSAAEKIFTAVVASRRELSLYGVPLFLLFSTRLFASVRIALDSIRAVRTRRRFLHDLLYDLILVVATTTLFAANSYVSVPALGSSGLEALAAHLLAIGFGTVLFFVVYFMAPTEKLEWHTAALVAFLVAVLFEIFKVLFGVYLVQFGTGNRIISHANAIAVLLFVLWIYLTAILFLMGGEIAKAVEEHRESMGALKTVR